MEYAFNNMLLIMVLAVEKSGIKADFIDLLFEGNYSIRKG
jgi:hypothetical protein